MYDPNAPTQTLSRDDILVQWKQAQDALRQAINTELQWRKVAIDAFFAPKPDEEGTQNFELGQGYKLKATFKLNYNLGKRDDVDDMLDDLSNCGNDGKFVAERIVNWSPSLSLSEYRSLTPAHKAIVDKQLTVKPALPSLELVEPKA